MRWMRANKAKALALLGLAVIVAGGDLALRLTRASPVSQPTSGLIAFVSWRDSSAEIYVMNADGSGQTRLTNSPGDDRFPAWSPDGRKIAFNSWRDGNLEIYVMNADGSGQTNLNNNPASDFFPAWQPVAR